MGKVDTTLFIKEKKFFSSFKVDVIFGDANESLCEDFANIMKKKKISKGA